MMHRHFVNSRPRETTTEKKARVRQEAAKIRSFFGDFFEAFPGIRVEAGNEAFSEGIHFVITGYGSDTENLADLLAATFFELIDQGTYSGSAETSVITVDFFSPGKNNLIAFVGDDANKEKFKQCFLENFMSDFNAYIDSYAEKYPEILDRKASVPPASYKDCVELYSSTASYIAEKEMQQTKKGRLSAY